MKKKNKPKTKKTLSHKIIHFIKYHNAFAIAFVIVFMGLSITFAASPEARDAVYSKKTKEAGVDNAILLSADVSSWDFEPQILNIEQDNKYYYVTYKYRTLGIEDNVWQAVWKEKLLKFEIDSGRYSDVSQYITKEIREVIQHEYKLLKDSKEIAQTKGRTQKVTVTQYSGLVGKILDMKPKVVVHDNPTDNQQGNTENGAEGNKKTKGAETGSERFNRASIAQIVEDILRQKGLIAQGDSSSDTTNSSSSCSSCTAGGGAGAQATGDDAFVALDVYATTTVNTPVNIVLKASQSGLNFVVTSGVSHGELSGSEPNMVYTPEDSFIGTDQFTFQVYSNGTYSENAWVYITVLENSVATNTATTTDTTDTDTSTTTEPSTEPPAGESDSGSGAGTTSTTTTVTCGSERLDLCNTQQKCESAGLYWYNDSCNLEPQLICDSEHLNLCATETECSQAGLYWYNGACNLEPQLTCDSSHLDLCSTELDCQNAAGYWYNGTCNLEACNPDWQCTDWQPLPNTVCSGETFGQTRNCSDLNNCGLEEGKPLESQQATGTKDCNSTTTPAN